MNVNRIILIAAAVFVTLYVLNVDGGMSEVECRPNGMGGEICAHPGR